MMKQKRISLIAGVLMITPLCTLAAKPEAALDGNCPVCLVKMNKLVKGARSISSQFDGRRYLFPTARQKKMFDANPAAFVPVMDGNCTVCKVELGKDVPGKAQFHVVHDGRLFLFPSAKQKKMFQANPQKYANADLALGGDCAVCLIKKNKIVHGKQKYVSVYDGQRYLFPSPKQKRMFDAVPAAFVPAMGGKCTVCKVEMNKSVPGKSEYHLTHNGRLYLFASAKQKKMFQSNPEKYANADVALNGYCTVCKVEMGKDVKGKADFAVDHDGLRYLFPGAKQRNMFLANPAKYTVKQ